MKSILGSLLVIALLTLVGCTSTGQSPKATLWTLDNLTTIGGYPVELIGSPQVVASPIGKVVRFNGQSNGLLLPINPLQGYAEFTVEMLIKPDSGGPLEQRFLHMQDDANSRGLLELRMYPNGWALDAFLFSGPSQRALFDQTKLHPADRWTWVAMTYRGGKLQSFVDGVKELEGDVTFPPMSTGKTSLGVRQNLISWFKGELRQARFHPTALPAESLQQVKS